MSIPHASELAVAQSSVPTGYAEKAMASLMQLHSELMEEKEKRVDLFRRLMEKEQALAELKMYVKVLEEKHAALMPPPPPAVPREQLRVAPRPPPPGMPPASPPPPAIAAQPPPQPQPPAAPMGPMGPPAVPNVARVSPTVRSMPTPDGWKTW